MESAIEKQKEATKLVIEKLVNNILNIEKRAIEHELFEPFEKNELFSLFRAELRKIKISLELLPEDVFSEYLFVSLFDNNNDIKKLVLLNDRLVIRALKEVSQKIFLNYTLLERKKFIEEFGKPRKKIWDVFCSSSEDVQKYDRTLMLLNVGSFRSSEKENFLKFHDKILANLSNNSILDYSYCYVRTLLGGTEEELEGSVSVSKLCISTTKLCANCI